MALLTIEDLRLRRVQTIVTQYAGGGEMQFRKISARTAMALKRAQKPDASPEDSLDQCRQLLRHCLVTPEPTDELLDALEDDMPAYTDLVNQLLRINGLSEEVRAATANAFREGQASASEAPAAK